jgi:predicted ArsR family transcriptional regulator
MLDHLLELLRAGGTHRVGDLARALDTTPELVQVMLDDLSRMGYLRQVGGQCTEACGTCPMAGLCAAGSSGQLWTLTEKGTSTDAAPSQA